MDSGKMEKKMLEDVYEKRESKSSLILFAIAFVVLAVAFITMVACGAWYISDLKDSDNDSKESKELVSPISLSVPREFEIGMPRYHNGTTSMSHVFVWVDEINQIEYVTMKDPILQHVMYILLIDHKKKYQVIWGSEIAECLFVPGEKHSLASDLEFLWQHKNLNASMPNEFFNYRRGERVTAMQDIPPQLASFCSVSNSRWLYKADDRRDGERQVCVCPHAYCWCLWCTDILCLGTCACLV